MPYIYINYINYKLIIKLNHLIINFINNKVNVLILSNIFNKN